MQPSKAPDTIDAESFASNLTLVKSLFPTMPEASVRRASWAIARSHLSLAAAVAQEGFSLDGTGAPLAAVRVDPTKNPNHKAVAPALPLTASQIAQLATLKADIRALGPPPAPPPAAQPAAPVANERKTTTADDAAHLRLAAEIVERAGLEGRATAATVADFKRRAASAAAGEVERVNAAAIAAMEKTPGLSYFQAVQENAAAAK